MRKTAIVLLGIVVIAGFYLYISGLDLHEELYSILSGGSSAHKDAAQMQQQEQGIALERTEGSVHPTQSQWVLVWEDDFDRNIDLENWNEIEREQSYNNELQYYSQLNAYADSGCLFLTAKKESKGDKRYTSASVDTLGKRDFLYGKLEIRMKIPLGQGFCPAVWMLPVEGSDDYREIDIVEMVGSEPDAIYAGNHFMTAGTLDKNYGQTTVARVGEYHVYGMEWYRDRIVWSLDNKPYHTSYRGIPQEKMYIIFNLAVGGDWAGDPDPQTPFPASMVIDYVKYYEHA